MTETHGTTATGTGRPRYRAVTANQVVAWNLARYRRAARMTQEQLGIAIGWKTSAVSDAERSWKSGRTREFNAQEMTEIALALAIPVGALLLPPDPDDGEMVEVRNQGGAVSLAEYLAEAVNPDSDLREPATEAYRKRYVKVAARFLSPEWAAHVARLMHGAHSAEWIADLAAMLREHQRDTESAASKWGYLAGELEALAGKEDL